MSDKKPDQNGYPEGNANSFSVSLPAGAEGQSKQLSNKVILIAGLASERSCHLAIVFAQMGSDIAIVCSRDAYQAATRVAEQVEALGQRCLTIISNSSGYLAQEVIQQVIAIFGHLDVFISYPLRPEVSKSSLTEELATNGSGHKTQRRLYRSLVFPNFSLMKAALDQIIIE